MSDGTASAIPSDLTHWAYWASGLNKSLDGTGRQVNQAIEDFNRASQEPRFIGPLDQVGDDVIGYAARNGVIDDWVGKVGRVFIQADHKGVPPQVYKANREDFITGLNSASEADLARLVGDDPVKQAEDAANGAELAARLKRAEDANDEGSIRVILSQLRAWGPTQEFAYHFFNELGPDQTIKTLIIINGMEDDGLLHNFDNALGQASQHPNWDPEFTSALLDPKRQAWDQLPNTAIIQVSMLKYGTFSEDFLTRSADYFLFSDKHPNITADDQNLVVFNALDRNPNAAYNYLTGHYQVGDKNLARVQYMLGYSTRAYPTGENTVLGELIADAGFSDNGRRDNGNQLLQAIGSIDIQNTVADDIRPGIERLLAGYIGNFAGYTPPKDLPPEGQFTWQEQLFMIAEMNADGSLNEGRMTDLQNAATKWLASHMTPMEHGPAGPWFGQAGALYGLTLLPVRKAGWNNYDMEKARIELWKTTLDFTTGFLPEWFHKLKDVPITTLTTIDKSYFDAEPGDAQTADWDLYKKSASPMVPNLVLALVGRDPKFLPPSLRGRPLDDPQVHDYLNGILTSVADGTHNPKFQNLHLTDSEQHFAQDWANAIGSMTNNMQTYFGSRSTATTDQAKADRYALTSISRSVGYSDRVARLSWSSGKGGVQ
jgi:hypothetical protein